MTMLIRLHVLIGTGLTLALGGSAVRAQQIVTLTPSSNLSNVLNALRPGDTLQVTGTFTSPLVIRNRDFGNVTVQATGAVFQAGVLLNNVHNIRFDGGTYGRSDAGIAAWHTFRVDNSSHVSIANATVLGNGDNIGTGILMANSRFVTVRDNQLSGHMTGIGVRSSSDALVVRNRIVGSTADGINIVDNQRVIVSSNSCSGFAPGVGAHPDCIQLWSINGKPLQSDIFVINNSSVGVNQGYLSTDPKTGSGTRLTFAGNYVLTTTFHGITCGNCTFSQIFENVIGNLPTSVNGVPSLKLGPSPTNVVGTNQFYDLRGRTDGWLPSPTWTSFVPDIAGLVGSRWDLRDFSAGSIGFSAAATSVPEPASWLMLGFGFAVIGRMLRRRRGLQLAAA